MKMKSLAGKNNVFVPLRKELWGCRQLYQTNQRGLVRCYQYYNSDTEASFKKNSNLLLKLKWFGRGFGAKNKKQLFLKLLKLLGFIIVCLLNACSPALATTEEELRRRLKPLFIEHIRPRLEDSFYHLQEHSSLLRTNWTNYDSSSNLTSGLPTPESPRSPFFGYNAAPSSPSSNVSPNLVRVNSAPDSLGSPRSGTDPESVPRLNSDDVNINWPPRTPNRRYYAIKLFLFGLSTGLTMYRAYRSTSAAKKAIIDKLQTQIKNLDQEFSRLRDENEPEILILDERVFETEPPLNWVDQMAVICKLVFQKLIVLYNKLLKLTHLTNQQVQNILLLIIITVIIAVMLKRIERKAINKKQSRL